VPRLNIGLIGCGGRGKWITDLFLKTSKYNLVACADYFPARVSEAGTKFSIPENQRFSGLNGYKRMLEQKLDAVVIESPPCCHPEQAAAAVDAGKHVYLAKPIAVDVPGCLTVEESGRKATAKKLCFLVDFQTRASKHYQEAMAHAHKGELGPLVCVEAAYHCGPTWDHMDAELRKSPNDPETRLKAWGVSRVLSGDIITEQNIHALDVACWLLKSNPIEARGLGGRRRPFVGDCWDHFAVVYKFPGDVLVSFNSHQSGFGYDDILCRAFGLEGTLDTHYFGKVTFHSKEFRSSNEVGNLYSDGAITNIHAFYDNIAKGDFSNPTVAASVQSNLTTILGREAAYRNEVVTWNQMMKRKETFRADLKGLKV
jgi:predicted dehydrogenase